MASVTSNRGKYALLGVYFRTEAALTPTGFNIALITDAGIGTGTAPVAPTASNALTWAALSANEIPVNNGYVAGGIAITRTSSDFTTFTEDDANNRAIIGIRDIVWTAAGGNLPSSGTGARYAVLMDNTTSKNVFAIFDLGANRVVSDTQSFTLRNIEYILN